mgnify:FL=1
MTIAADGRRGIINLDTGDMSVYRDGDEDALLEFEARPGETGSHKATIGMWTRCWTVWPETASHRTPCAIW